MSNRVLLYTNVLVSGLLVRNTPPARVVDAILSAADFVTSPDLINELASVLRRRKFDAFITPDARESLLARFVERSILVFPKTSVSICRDPDDNHLLAVAIDGGARYLVTGDDDLLVLDPFENIRILKPADFLELSLPDRNIN